MTTPSPPVLFVDLDGTVRHGKAELGRFVNEPDDVVLFPEAVQQMRDWRDEGGVVIGVTNQGGVGDGYLTKANHDAICDRTLDLAGGALASIVACTHATTAQCWCRKPLPGLIYGAIEVAAELTNAGTAELERLSCLMVGDRPEDQQAAAAAGVPFQWAGEWRRAAR